ncbi:MAG: NADH-quinone oxidoreductase subunit NuoE [Deltaproteobacteria bacterium]
MERETRQKIIEDLASCPSAHAVCFDALRLAEKHNGWVSDDSIREVAELLDMTPEEVDAAATFYNHIYRKPVGRHVILVCESVSCWIVGGQTMMDFLKDHLGIQFGETTSDEKFTLLPIQCLGACDCGPAMMVDDDLYGDLDAEKVKQILECYD